jgi:hypothetical protein
MRNNLIPEKMNPNMGPEPNPDLFFKFSQNPKFSRFYASCEDALQTLRRQELKITKVNFDENSILSIRRMLGLYVDLEEFEKCCFLKSLLEKCSPNNTTPVFDYREVYG